VRDVIRACGEAVFDTDRKAAFRAVRQARARGITAEHTIVRRAIPAVAEMMPGIARNGWQIDAGFRDPAPRGHLDRPSAERAGAPRRDGLAQRDAPVRHGSRHPRPDALQRRRHALRRRGRNCIAMLLGYDRSMDEAAKGVRFLLVDRGPNRQPMIAQAFGSDPPAAREREATEARHGS